MAREGERLHTGNTCVYAEFLRKLPRQGVLGSLARIDLTARKLPQPRELLARRPLRDEHPTIGVHERGRDNQKEFCWSERRDQLPDSETSIGPASPVGTVTA